MCLGCRERGPVSTLVRVAVIEAPDGSADGARLAIDHRRNLPGRGAWLHPTPSCVTAAVRRRAFGPALRRHGLSVRPDDLAELFGEGGHEGPPRGQTGE